MINQDMGRGRYETLNKEAVGISSGVIVGPLLAVQMR